MRKAIDAASKAICAIKRPAKMKNKRQIIVINQNFAIYLQYFS
jgi:hypothetical protein